MEPVAGGEASGVETATSGGAVQTYPVDIRLSFPFFGRRLFFVLLGGAEQRSAERLRQERQKHSLWTFANICTIAFGLLFVVPALIGLAHMLISALGGL